MEHELEPTHNQFTLKDRITLILVLLGVVSSLFIGLGLILKLDNLKGIGTLFAMTYSIVFIWWLTRRRPRVDEQPDFSPILNLFKSYWGLLAIILHLTTGLLILFGLTAGDSNLVSIMNLPIFLQEMVMAVWLILKEFNPAAIPSGSVKQL